MTRIAAAALALIVAACQTTPPATAPTSSERQAPGPAASEEASRRETRPPAPRPPGELLRMVAEEAERRLGPADFRRHDPPAQLWQYRGDSCVLDLFLYPRADDGRLAVDHFETRPRGGDAVDPAACYGALLARTGTG